MSRDKVEEANVEAVHKLVALANDRKYGELSKLFATDVADHTPGQDQQGIEAVEQHYVQRQDRFDLKNEVRDVIAGGDKVFLGTASTGRHLGSLFGMAETGKELRLSTFEIFRFEETKIAERWMLCDLLSLAPQLEATVPGLDLGAIAEYDFYSKWDLNTSQMPSEDSPEENIQRVFAMFQGIGARDNNLLDQAMAADFQDHHPGVGDVTSSAQYRENIESFFQSMNMTGRTEVIFSKGDRVVNRGTLIGRHVGPFYGLPATGREVEWTTIEVYRIENNKVQERWAIDDLYGLFSQLGISL